MGEPPAPTHRKFQEVANRLERGKRYVRNGSVCHLAIEPGKATALAAGSEPYDVAIGVKKLSPAQWNALKRRVAGRIGSLLSLLQGSVSDEVMSQLADEENGLFPKLEELSFTCSRPDAFGSKNWICKHIAAVLYGIGRRFETQPELLFTFRGVDSRELIAAGTEAELKRHIDENSASLKNDELENIFGIEPAPEESKSAPKPKSAIKARGRKIAKTDNKTTSHPQNAESVAVKTKTAAKVKTAKANTAKVNTAAKINTAKTNTAKVNTAKTNTAVKVNIAKAITAKTVASKKTSNKPKPVKTAALATKVTESEQTKIKKAADKSGLSQNAFLLARLNAFGKTDSVSNASTRKLKRSKKDAKRDVQVLIRLLPTEKKRIQKQALRSKKSITQFVYDVLFE